MITLNLRHGGETLVRAGVYTLNGIKLVTSAFHVKGESNPRSNTAVPVFNILELAKFRVNRVKFAKSRAYIYRFLRSHEHTQLP